MDTEVGERFEVEGGVPISGTVVCSGNKNEALPVLAATLLTEQPCLLENVPRIRDAEAMQEILDSLGVSTEWLAGKRLRCDASQLSTRDPDERIARTIRGSFLFAPGLLHRTGKAVLPRPGGDRIGRRRVDTHLLALRALGAEVDVKSDHYVLTLNKRFRGADVFLDEASVMATENAVMAAAVADGRTRIMNAASEPHVQGLCRLLVTMGAEISGIGSNCLEVIGRAQLGGAAHRIDPDHIEIGSFMAIAAMTGGEMRIKDVVPDHLRMICMVYRRLGVQTHFDGTDLIVPGKQDLRIQEDLHGAIPKVDDAPWPGFPADLTSIALVLATQSSGTVVIHEKMFESRLFFVDRLLIMGARVVLCDPHRAVVVGPCRLHGATMGSPDIRAGMALLSAALCAEGHSVIQNAQQIDRGYENIEERLRALGASIKRT